MKASFSNGWTSSRTSDMVMSDLVDVERVASWLSVVSEVTQERPLEKYYGVLTDSLGSFQFRADLDIDVVVEPHRILLKATGRDRQIGSRLSLEGVCAAEPQPGGCRVTVSGSYEVSGKAATLASGSIRRKATKLFDTFCDHLEREVLGPAPVSVVEGVPNSQKQGQGLSDPIDPSDEGSATELRKGE